MTLLAFILILTSTVLHAGWNFLCKSHNPTPSFTLVLNAATAVLLLPFIFLVDVAWSTLPPAFWFAATFSIVANTFYCVFLALAYKKGDISISYPLLRSIPVLLTAAVTTILHIGAMPSVLDFIGLVIIFIGCVFLPQPNFKSLAIKNFLTPALVPIVCAACGTTGYTICDSVATRHFIENASSSRIIILGAYFFTIQVGLSIVQWIYLYFIAPRKNRKEMREALVQPYPYLAGLFNCLAYFLVLAAMGYVSNVCYVQAFRQMSLPIGVFAGIKFLHEKMTAMKVYGIILIVLGLILTVI